ncbi:preprotein translocase subunit YajC [Pelagicoccus sp. NFK12]|uniref:Sec translocon accessory complex subunit YajC n=1 Tax=Pelagicoccus enzymogenes TaxID=2773457 RepID=A0A927F9C0_9BACT|nr:preprotein translocase subunit YajC [Pelagicoccus enzymogenes]MBD5780116.1 preprotein translocase subunit YajC [Pelagicoccus enzymogenes]MDQ8200660.1 preprotein translocase subunit YajC [Pelagicoccus enzymogenes]
MDISSIVLAQEAAPQGGIMSFLPFIVIFAAMYFLIIAPQRKKQKQHQQMITELKSGAEIVTSGGIYGTITNVKDDRFVVKIAENTKIEISKASVASVVTPAE